MNSIQGLGLRRLRILMVDDSTDDISFVERALHKSGVGQYFRAVHDGSDALKYLKGEEDFGDRSRTPFPNIILSDLKMPGMDGYDLLDWLKNHPTCAVIPTIIFTSSSLESDVRKAYELGANAYMVKPSDLAQLVDLIVVTCKFWSQCEIPQTPPDAKCP